MKAFWRKGKRVLGWGGWLALWTLVVCYPNPLVFFRNFARYAWLPVDAAVGEEVREPIPDDPAQIEQFVCRLVPYQFDWRNYGVPWYVPTPREVVRTGSGDCESRAVLFASLLKAKEIPFDLKASFTHLWVDYPKKKKNRSENDDIAYIGKRKGRFFVKLPTLRQWREQFVTEKEALWDVMPTPRKGLLVGGWIGISLWAWLRRRQGGEVVRW